MRYQIWGGAGALAATLLSAAGPAMSQAITVGKTRGGSCLFSTIGAAITEAKSRWDRDHVAQEIRITRDVVNGVWNNVNVTLADMDVVIAGGYADCDSQDVDALTVVSGAGGAREPVFSIAGRGEVRFENLQISDGDAVGNEGGGIDFLGRGHVQISNSTLSHNVGGQGGAIRVEAVAGEAKLSLGPNVMIEHNRAEGDGNGDGNFDGDGGGIVARGRVNLDLHGPGSQLSRNSATGNGGGLDFQGFGEVELENILVEQNNGGRGGGLHIVGRTDNATLTVGDNVSISGNTARGDGGGLDLQGLTLTGMLGKHTSVAYNQSSRMGGGLALEGPGYAWIGAAGPELGIAVFRNNSAARGGAIAVKGRDGHYDQGWLYIYTGYADYPMTVSENTASQAGGAFYGIGQAGGGDAKLCIQNTSMYANRAPQGAAVYADTDNQAGLDGQSGHLELNFNDLCDSQPESVACAGPFCNQITFNRAQLPDGTPSTGAVFETGDPRVCSDLEFCDDDPWVGQHFAGGVVMRNNVANTLITGRTPFALQNIAAHENQLVSSVLDGNIRMLHGSFAGNTGPFASTQRTGWVRSSLFLLGPMQKLMDEAVREDVAVAHVISNDFTGAPSDPSNYLSGDPGFVNAQTAGFNLHLRPQAMAIDTAPEPANMYEDLDRKTRTVDVLARANQYGPTDRGAYEFQDAGTPPDPDPDPDPKPELLRDGFEDRVN